jgi:GH24 family phage-related lysozyme (muramidase)
MAWKMTGNDEIMAPVIEAYHRGEIPDREAELIADIAGLDPRQRGLIASKSDHLFSAAAKYTPEQQRLSGGGITGRKDGNFPSWVWRMKPGSDVIQNPDGSVSSHLMGHEQLEDGTWIAFPYIQRDESGQLKDYGDEAMDRVLESGNYFKYPDEKSAAAYSMGSWKQPGREPGTGDEGLIARLTKGMGDGRPAPRPDTMEFREGVDSPGRRDTMEFREGIDNPGTTVPLLQTETGKMLHQHESSGRDFFEVYKDTEGIKTIGVGYNLEESYARGEVEALGLDYDKVLAGTQKINAEQQNALFEHSYKRGVADARSFTPEYDNLPKGAQDVLVDMSFNMGGPRLKGFKNFKAAIEEKNYTKAKKEMEKSTWFRKHKESSEKAGRPDSRATNMVNKFLDAIDHWRKPGEPKLRSTLN